MPAGLTGVRAIAAGYNYSVALVTEVAFGEQLLGTTGAPRTFTITNTGKTALKVASVSVGGGNAGDFTVLTTGLPGSVPATKGATAFTVAFRPGALGPRATTLRVLSDDANEATYDIPLTGLGTIPQATDDTGFTTAREPIDLDVLANDPGVSRSVARLAFVTPPQHGTAQEVDGKVRYTPRGALPPDGDTFTYRFTDDRGESRLATARIVNFAALAGDYDGLLADGAHAFTGAEAHERSGYLRLSVTRDGAFSGVLTFAGVDLTSAVDGCFRGFGRDNRLGTTRLESRIIERPPLAPITLAFQYDADARAIVATASSVDAAGAAFVSTGVLSRRVPDPAASGPYTLGFEDAAIVPLAAVTPVPLGRGYAAMRISRDGRVQLTGRLADGAALSRASYLYGDYSFPLYARLYRGAIGRHGSLRGSVGVARPPQPGSGAVFWFKPERMLDVYFAKGFDLAGTARCWRFTPPARGEAVLTLGPDAVFSLTRSFAAKLDQPFTLDASDRATVTGLTGFELTLYISPTTGLFSGTFRHPEGDRRATFHGAVAQGEDRGFGHVLGLQDFFGALVTIQHR